MFKPEHLTSIAALVDKNAEQYVANFKGAEGDDYDVDAFVETFAKDLRKVRKQERETQLNRGLVTNRDAVLAKIKSYDPDFEFDGTKPDEALDAFYQSLTTKQQAAIDAARGGGSASFEDITVEEMRQNPVFQEAWREQAAKNEKQLQAALKRAEEEAAGYERKKQELVLSTRASKIKAKVVQWANEAGINLADASKDPGLYKTQINTLLYNPAFSPQNWAEDGDELVPVDADGQRLKTEDFHDMTGLDLVKSVNPYGFRKFDPNQSTPGATSRTGGGLSKMDFTTYTAKKQSLLAAGDSAGALKLSQDWIASQQG